MSWYRNKWFHLSVFLLGLAILIVGLLCAYVIFPDVVDKRIYREYVDLWNPESRGRQNFETSPMPVYMRAHVFEIDNPLDTKEGKKPIAVDRGPYTYRVSRNKFGISDEINDGDLLRYGQTRSFEFVKELSCETCHETDSIMTLNAPLLTIINVLERNRANLNTSGLLSQLNEAINSGTYADNIFVNQVVSSLLFTGVMVPSMEWLYDTHPELVHFMPDRFMDEEDGFAILDIGPNGQENPWFYEVDTGQNNMSQAFDITLFGSTHDNIKGPGLDHMDWWRKDGGYQNSNYANNLFGTDGFQFHPHVEETEQLWVFLANQCKCTFYEFEEKGDMEDVPYYRFVIPPMARDISTKDNLGFCMEYERAINWNECAKEETPGSEILEIDDCLADENYQGYCIDAAISVQRCYGYTPFTISNPHFFQSPDELWNSIEKLEEPNMDKHGSYLHIEPQTGLLLNFSWKHQVNIPMKQVQEIDSLSEVREVLMPFLWFEETGVIDSSTLQGIHDEVTHPKDMFDVTQWLMVGLGALFMVAAIAAAIWFR